MDCTSLSPRKGACLEAKKQLRSKRGPSSPRNKIKKARMETQNNTLCEARWETAREVQCFLFCFCCFRIRSPPSRSASKGPNSALRRVSILTRLSPLFGSISAEDAQSSAFANRIDRRRFSLTRRDLFFSFDFFRKYNFHPRQVTCFAGCIAMEMRGVSGSIIVLEVLGTSSLMQHFFY